MACNKYQNGLIYTIKTDNGLYVGSTCNFTNRKRGHKNSCFNKNNRTYNYKVYKNIRENGGEYTIEIYKMFPCNSDKELRSEEEEVRKYLNPNLNMNSAFQSVEGTKEKLAEKITCECGIEITKGCLPRHRKTQKHLKLMELKIC